MSQLSKEKTTTTIIEKDVAGNTVKETTTIVEKEYIYVQQPYYNPNTISWPYVTTTLTSTNDSTNMQANIPLKAEVANLSGNTTIGTGHITLG